MQFEPIALMPGVTLRVMEQRDLNSVVAMEKQSGGSCSKSIFLVRLAMRGYLSFVVEQGETVVSFGVILFKAEGEAVVADGLRLVSNGHGAAFAAHALKALKPTLKALGAVKLVGRCRPGLLRYYSGLGFSAVGTLPRFFGAEDAVALEQKL